VIATRQFNGNEVAFLMGWAEDSKHDFVVHREKLGRRHDGYEYDQVVVKHPDGKLYQFEVAYDDEHGIIPCCERPNDLIPAIEVEPVEVVTIAYRPKAGV
jgi:hypothetical protein